MIRWIATLLIVALVGWVGVVPAQQQTPTAEKMMEGKVKAVDEEKKLVTLEDGTVFTVPAMVQVSWAELKPGMTVAISYTEAGEAGQQKVVKKVELK